MGLSNRVAHETCLRWCAGGARGGTDLEMTGRHVGRGARVPAQPEVCARAREALAARGSVPFAFAFALCGAERTTARGGVSCQVSTARSVTVNIFTFANFLVLAG